MVDTSCEACLEYGWIGGVISMASAHGLLLAMLFLISKRLRSKSSKYLSMALLGLFVILGYEAIFYTDVEEGVPSVIQYLPLYLRTTIPVGLFYFTLFLIQPSHQLKGWEKVGFWALAIEVLVESLYFPITLLFGEDASAYDIYLESAGQLVGILTALALIPWALVKVTQYQRYLYNNYSSAGAKSLSWLRNFLVATLLLVVLWTLSFIQCAMGWTALCAFTFGLVTIGLLVLLFWIGYFVILHASWFDIVEIKEQKKENDSSGKLSSKTEVYHQQLLDLMKDQRLYEQSDLTLESLAEQLQISSGYLSQIINEKEEKNFFEFVNRYRIESVKERLADPDFENYTIMGIALECGFQSKSTFNATFKKYTGSTPSAYRKLGSISEKGA